MATYTATAAQANAPAIYAVNRDVTRIVSFSLSGALSASAGDIFQMVKIPVGATILRVNTAIDNQTGVITVNVGDGNDVSKYAASLVLSGSVITTTALSGRGLGYVYTAEDTVDIKVTAISTPSAVGELKLAVTYTNQP